MSLKYETKLIELINVDNKITCIAIYFNESTFI